MRALFASVAIISAIAVVPAAYAASLTMTGTVKSIDAAKKELKLSNGDTFVLPANFKDAGIKAGEKVKISYQKSGKTLDAEMVTVAK
jgi:mannose-6-phosphate isomerase class I